MATAPSDPFLAYTDIFPSRPASAIQLRGVTCQNIPFKYYSPTYCDFTPAEGIFSEVTLFIYEDRIRQITFLLRENTLTIGDLQLFLGVPSTHQYPQMAHFALTSSFALATTDNYAGRFSLFLPVRRISFYEFRSPI